MAEISNSEWSPQDEKGFLYFIFHVSYVSLLVRFPFGYEGYSHKHSQKEKQSKSKSGIQKTIPYNSKLSILGVLFSLTK